MARSYYFIINEDDSLYKLPINKYEKLFRGNPNVKLEQYRNKTMRAVFLYVEMTKGKAPHLIHVDQLYLKFDKKGRLDQNWIEEQKAYSVKLFPQYSDPSSNVVPSANRFHQKRFKDKFKWESTSELQNKILETIGLV